MAYYLVTAVPRKARLGELKQRLARDEFSKLRPFGGALTKSLRDARRLPDGLAMWEEEDYCRPPLAQERAAVLDDYFDKLQVEPVREGEGWLRIEGLERLFPDLKRRIVPGPLARGRWRPHSNVIPCRWRAPCRRPRTGCSTNSPS